MSIFGEWSSSAIGILPSPQAAGTVNGPGIARTGPCVVAAMTGVTTGTPTSFTVNMKLQDSDDGSAGWADVAGATVPTITTASTLAELNWTATPRAFVRVVSVVAFVGGTTPTVQVAAVITMGDRSRPS